MPPATDRAPRVRFDELAMFVEVAEAGSLAAAARRLGVPRSTVGRALARLEADLGAVLVTRAAGPSALTEPGRALLARAAPHVTALRDVTAAIAREEQDIHGTLRITAPGDLAQIVLAPLVATFLARHPGVSVEIDASLRMVDLAAEGFDLALRVAQRALAPSSLVAQKLARLYLGLFASPTYLAVRGAPRRTEDLDAHDHVLLFGRHGRGTLALEGPRGHVRVAVRGRATANDFGYMRELIAGGAGIGPLPWHQASADVATGRLARVLPDHRLSGTTAYMVHLPLRPLPAKTAAFKRMLLTATPRLLVEPR